MLTEREVAELSEAAASCIDVAGRGVRAPLVTVSTLDDGTVRVRIDDERDTAFWLDIDLPPCAARALADLSGPVEDHTFATTDEADDLFTA